MFFGRAGERKLDIRVRITNGEGEVVIKSGFFGAYDRVEISQMIEAGQFLGPVKIMAQLAFKVEVGERETFNFKLAGGIVVSLVYAGPLVYIELEKMSSELDLGKNNNQLKKLASPLGLQILNEKEFDALCNRLADKIDWPFGGESNDYDKLGELLALHINKRAKR